MASNIYTKLSNMREAIKKEQFSDFNELVRIVGKKAKNYKVIPLYCYCDSMATLKILDLDEITSSVTFQVPADLVNITNAKEYLYCMAFDVCVSKEKTITPKQYITLCEKMKEHSVTETDIKERYQINSMADMTQDIYKRCMAVLEKMDSK